MDPSSTVKNKGKRKRKRQRHRTRSITGRNRKQFQESILLVRRELQLGEKATFCELLDALYRTIHCLQKENTKLHLLEPLSTPVGICG